LGTAKVDMVRSPTKTTRDEEQAQSASEDEGDEPTLTDVAEEDEEVDSDEAEAEIWQARYWRKTRRAKARRGGWKSAQEKAAQPSDIREL